VIGASDVVTPADQIDSGAALQVGPDALDLVYNHAESGPVLIDRVVYKGALDECAIAEGSPAPDAEKEWSIARVPDGSDSNDNGVDFQACDTPTPGLPNACSAPPCTGEPPALVINELQISATSEAPLSPFVEIKGPPGTPVGCFRLIGVNGSGCGPYNVLDLEGAIPAGGYYVVADGDKIAGAQLRSSKADYQDGPDGLDLVYQHPLLGDVVVDSIVYGEALPDCSVGEGNAAPDPGKDSSLARAPDGSDTNDNVTDFVVCPTPTPGAANTCTGGGNGPGDPTSRGGGGAACAVSHTASPGALLLLLFLALVPAVLRPRRSLP
jgi:hypothetical protein